MDDVKLLARRVVFGIVGIISALLSIRFLLLLLNANRSHFLVKIFFDLTAPLVEPFVNTINTLNIGGLQIDANTVIALGVYIYVGFIIIDFIRGLFDYDPINVLVNVIDSILKVLEFLLLSRFILAFFGVIAGASPFSLSIYSLTGWSQGILPYVPFLWGDIELSTLLVLVIVVILDLSLENGVKVYRQRRAKKVVTKTQKVRNRPPQKQQSQQQGQPQNITVNVNTPGVMTPPPPRQVRVQKQSTKRLAPPEGKVVRDRKYQ